MTEHLQPIEAADLFRLNFVGSPQLSPDGKRGVFVLTRTVESDNAYTSALWLFEPGRVRQLTNLGGSPKGRDTHPCWSPGGDAVAFLSDRTEKKQLWLLDMSGGEPRQLTQVSQGVHDYRWGPDGNIYFTAREEEPESRLPEKATARRITHLRYKFNGAGYSGDAFAQLWRLDVLTGVITQLTHGPHNCGTPIPSPDGRWVAFTSNRSDDETALHVDLWLLDVTTNELRNLTGNKGRVYDVAWGEDGTTLYYLGDERAPYPGGYPTLWRLELSTGRRERLAPEFPHLIGGGVGTDARFDGGSKGLTVTGSSLYFAALVGGNSYLYRLDLASRDVSRSWGDGAMVVNSYDAVGDTLVVNRAAPDTPGDLWMGHTDGDLSRLTSFNDALLAEKYIGWPERLEFQHPDGTTLEGWVIRPINFGETTTHPVVLEIHGGPHSAYGNIFFHEFQVLAGCGYGVVYTNPRGSLGYGEDFARAVVGDWCGVDARDLEFMTRDTLRQLPWADAGRFGVTGGSQGGYFTNWLVSHTDLFQAAVTQRSMSNLYSKFGVSDIGWFGDRAGMGGRDLWEDEDFIMERSPIRYARNVHTPILIIHSDQDYRCPLEQAEQWYVALKRLGVTTEFLLFHGENHELSRGGKPANRLARLEAITAWFQRFL